MANYKAYYPQSSDDEYYQFDATGPSGTDFAGVGYAPNFLGLGPSTESSAVRVASIDFNQGETVTDAIFYLRVDARLGSSTVKVKIHGIKEPNTSDFSSGLGSRTLTTAQNTVDYTSGGTGWLGVSVTSIVNEILAQGAWSNGNHMGFRLEDNGTSTGAENRIYDQFTADPTSDSFLSILRSTNPNFTPTTTPIKVPSLPPRENYGIATSVPGFEATTTLEQHREFDSRARVLKVNTQGSQYWNKTTGDNKISHGLKYRPGFLTFFQRAGRVYRAPHSAPFSDNLSTPSGVGSRANTDIIEVGGMFEPFSIDPTVGDNWYYYSFIDENL